MDNLKDALQKLFGDDVSVEKRSPVFGGDINESFRLFLSDGRSVFMKTNRGKSADFFIAEANGLLAMADTGTIRVPSVFCVGMEEGSPFLLMEYLDASSPGPGFFESFGRSLAAMHLADASEYAGGKKFGFHEDNYIGATRQKNTSCDTWKEFYHAFRLLPQFEMASAYFDRGEKKRILSFLDRLDEYIFEPSKPSLLHGDLWSGNYLAGTEGEAILIDPAVYVGAAEADLAMTELFGGFPRAFYDAYHECIPKESGYEDRRDLYQLYHLLNHLNLFGPSYLPAVMRIVRRFS